MQQHKIATATHGHLWGLQRLRPQLATTRPRHGKLCPSPPRELHLPTPAPGPASSTGELRPRHGELCPSPSCSLRRHPLPAEPPRRSSSCARAGRASSAMLVLGRARGGALVAPTPADPLGGAPLVDSCEHGEGEPRRRRRDAIQGKQEFGEEESGEEKSG